MDFSAYELLDTFTLYDAAFLLCGCEPLSPGVAPTIDPHEVIRHKAATIAEQMVQDAKLGKLKAGRRDIGNSWQLAGAPEWIATRQALKDWATAKGIKPPFLFPELPPRDTGKSMADDDWGKHTTPNIEILKQAIAEFWENHNPESPPKKEAVVSWLKDRKVTGRVAVVMDTIMRTEKALKGGNKRVTPAKPSK